MDKNKKDPSKEDFSPTSSSVQNTGETNNLETPDMPPDKTSAGILTPANETGNSRRSFKKLIGGLVGGLILFLIFAVAGLYALAYEKIDIGNPDLQTKISFAVQSIPLTPKTPKYILAKAVMAHKEVTKETFDLSLALDSQSFTDILGLSKIDILLRGALDYSDPENIAANLTVFATKQFSLDLRVKEKQIYFKVNELPLALLSIMGLDTSAISPLLNQWVHYDATPLDTEARKMMEEEMESTDKYKILSDLNENYIDEMIRDNMAVSKVTEDNHNVYKLELNATDEVVDHIGDSLEKGLASQYPSTYVPNQLESNTRLSNTLKNVKLAIYIDRNSFLVRKVTFSAEATPAVLKSAAENTGAENQTTKVVFIAKLDNFNQDVTVETPGEFLDFNEFAAKVSEVTGGLFGASLESTGSLAGSDADAQIYTDLIQLQAAIDYYYKVCGSYPADMYSPASDEACGGSLMPNYVANVPNNPITNTPYYYALSGSSYTICTNVSQALEETDNCPNPNYNFRLPTAAQ